jgi:predicted TPR repeat methyltransferase
MDIFMKYTVKYRELPDPKILVPACGLGDDSIYLGEIGCHVHSFDLSEGMLSEARRADANGIYFSMDLRSIDMLQEIYDGVWARGCLYHLTPLELQEWFKKCFDRIAPGGILYFTLKDGIGEELLTKPSRNYSGGEEARRTLQGERYYAYYRPCETKHYFDPYFQVLRLSHIEGSEPAFEYWLRRRPPNH